jgi:hypothetical protein
MLSSFRVLSAHIALHDSTSVSYVHVEISEFFLKNPWIGTEANLIAGLGMVAMKKM